MPFKNDSNPSIAMSREGETLRETDRERERERERERGVKKRVAKCVREAIRVIGYLHISRYDICWSALHRNMLRNTKT